MAFFVSVFQSRDLFAHKRSTNGGLECYINNSRHLARKYAQIFVHGHCLFQEAHGFLRAKCKENGELQGAFFFPLR